MMGNNNTMKSLRGGTAFIQNLSTLGYDSNGIPTHLIDSVSGNNAYIIGGAFFQGDNIGYYESNSLINFDLNTYDINVSFIIANSTGGVESIFGSSSSNLRYWGLTSTGLEMRMGLSPSSNFTATFTTSFASGDLIEVSLLTTGAWTAKKTNLNGTIETDSNTGTVDAVGRFIGFIGSNRNGLDPVGVGISDLVIETVGNARNRWTFSESVVNASTHQTKDIANTVASGNQNNLTLNNGSASNQGVKGFKGDWMQNGEYIDGSSNTVPLLEDLSEFADGTVLSSGVVNDGAEWLRNGTKLKQSTTDTALITADSEELWYTSGVANEVSATDLISAISLNPTTYGAVVDADYIKNITLK